MKSVLLAIMLGVIVITPFVYLTMKPKVFVLSKQNFALGSTKTVKACKADKNKLILILDDDSIIHAYLSTNKKIDLSQVPKILIYAEPPAPSVLFKKRAKDGWLVEFYLTLNKKRYNLLDVL